MMVHIAGASQLDLNRRWATPTGLGQYDATLFPFADRAQKDGVSGTTDGLLDNDRARENLPKIFYTNTGVEYWGGGRIGRARPHDRRRHDRSDDSGECPRLLLRGQPAWSRRVSAGGRRGAAERQPDRLLVEHARALRGHGQVGQ